ncbi:hypothetical protein QTO34_010347 [Cnephaeus nilssonii]|uniref:Uncharacterized protein n=1 Tax=Cnephaeus nilssonii TaxID=3371016 RepID=A0AA40HFA8_CNENI|nr:hypothetical protein QTO34_010347 [Eptesicus nilssonii]
MSNGTLQLLILALSHCSFEAQQHSTQGRSQTQEAEGTTSPPQILGEGGGREGATHQELQGSDQPDLMLVLCAVGMAAAPSSLTALTCTSSRTSLVLGSSLPREHTASLRERGPNIYQTLEMNRGGRFFVDESTYLSGMDHCSLLSSAMSHALVSHSVVQLRAQSSQSPGEPGAAHGTGISPAHPSSEVVSSFSLGKRDTASKIPRQIVDMEKHVLPFGSIGRH